MLKSFKELYKLDISSQVKKKPTFYKDSNGKLQKNSQDKWLDYLEWATVITLLYENGAEKVLFGSFGNDNAYPAFYHQSSNPFVKVWVTIDDNQFELFYPVIDGNKVESNPNQMIIHKAQQRAFVKCVAINTGLGLKLWQKEESTFDELGEIEKQLPELTPDSPKWKEAIKALNNEYTIEQIEKKYYLTNENRNKLISESI